MTPIKMPRTSQKTSTEIAVLQVEFKNVEEKVNELKEDLKHVYTCMDNNNKELKQMILDMQDQDAKAHEALSKKVTMLEKWRWMMMGAGIVVGSLGFDALSKLLK